MRNPALGLQWIFDKAIYLSIYLSIYLTGMISMNGMTGIKGMTRMTRNDLTLDEWND